MKVFLSYFRHRGILFLFPILFTGIFSLVLYLYHAYHPAVWYAALLCACISLLYAVSDLFCFYRKHKTLCAILKHTEPDFSRLPKAADLLEEDYQKLLFSLSGRSQKQRFQSEQKFQDMYDYFTLWTHQIKIPLSAMHLLLQEQGESGQMLLELKKTEQYADMALQYLRIDSMSHDLLIKKYSLDSLVKEAVRSQSSFFIQKKIRLVMESLDCEVLTDKKWLSFVLEQLLSNALKYTPKGCIYISQKDCILTIRDTGIGIRKEDLPRIFERGFTGINGRYDKKATGIGLHLCSRILSNLGHEITISSEPGKGTAVTLNLQSPEFTAE